MLRGRPRTVAHHFLLLVGAGASLALVVAGVFPDDWLTRATTATIVPGYVNPEAPVAGFATGSTALAMFLLWYTGTVERRWPLTVAGCMAAYLLVLCLQYRTEIGTPAVDGAIIYATWALPVATAASSILVVTAALAALLRPPGDFPWTNPASWATRPFRRRSP